jgi:cell division protein FtsX
MMKYPGPKDLYRRLERRFISSIAVGVSIMVIAIVGNVAVNIGLSSTTVEVQRGVGEEPELVEIPFDRNNLIGILGIAVGSIVNFYSMNKYRSDYSEIKDETPRPSKLILLIGLGVTLGAMGIGWFSLIGF